MNKHTSSVSLIDGHIEDKTDAEIVKALEWCNSLSKRCGDGCPYYEIPYKNGKRCSEMMIDDALDLINRLQAKNKELDEKLIIQKGLIDTQKAEIERLNIRNQALTAITKNYDWKFAKAKSEAIKEFAEELKAYFEDEFIDNLVKEMTEVSE